MTDYSVINNVNVFVRLSGFVHPTSRHVLLESLIRSLIFLGLLGVTILTTLGSRYRSHLWSRISPSLWMKQRTEIDVSGSRCLATTMHCMPLVGQIRRFACDIVGPRATARKATHTKTSQRNKTYSFLFFWYYMYIVFIYISQLWTNTISL